MTGKFAVSFFPQIFIGGHWRIKWNVENEVLT
jgi:hypothetical protein